MTPSNSALNNLNLTGLFQNFALFSNTLTRLITNANPNINASFNSSNINDLKFVGTNPLTSSETIRIWYNTKGFVSNVAYLNVLNNAFLRSKEVFLKNNPKDHGNFLVKLNRLRKIKYCFFFISRNCRYKSSDAFYINSILATAAN